MSSNIFNKLSFVSLLLLVLLLPLFCLPFSNIPVEISKGLLLVVGLVLVVIFWTISRFYDGKIVLPKSSVLVAGAGVVLALLVSTLFSSAPQMSFFGIMFDVNTFWFVFSGFLLMLLSSIIFRKRINAKMALYGIILSSAVVLLFQVFHLFFPSILSLGILTTKTSNILGSWSALGLLAGFLGVMSLFVIEFFSTTGIIKNTLKVFLAFSVIFIAIVNFMLAWDLLGFFALVIFIYKISISFGHEQIEGQSRTFPGLPFSLFLISFLFFMSSQFIGGFLPNLLKVSNNEVSVGLNATMSITKQAIMKNPVLGIGPNRFTELWTMYKPAEINASQFWETPFSSGIGLIPTFFATTGLLGILAWFVFFAFYMINGLKSIYANIKRNTDKEIVAFFVASVYLFICTFLYSTGPVLFLLALSLAGVFIGLSTEEDSNKEVSLVFSDDPRKSFFSLLFLMLLMIASVFVGFKYVERFASMSYFGKTIGASSIEEARTNITKAISLYSNDLYLRTYAEINLLDINSIVSKGASSLSDADKTNLQSALSEAMRGANSAIDYNRNNYLNYSMLGSVYGMAVRLGDTTAYEKAISAFKQAVIYNPLDPGIQLSMANVAFVDAKKQEAKDFANQALSLKPDYTDALILLSQMAKSENNNTEAISYGEQALALDPTNKDIIQYVDSLKSVKTSSVNSLKDSSGNKKTGQ